MSAYGKKLNSVDDVLRKLPTEVIELCIDASVWKPFKGAILGNANTVPVSGITTVEIAEWAVANGLPLDARVSAVMIREGHNEVLEFLCSRGLNWYGVVWMAFEKKNFRMFQWLYYNGHLFKGGFLNDEFDVCQRAVDFDRVDICNWAIQEGFKCNFDTFCTALDSPNPEIRDWAVRIPFPQRVLLL